MSKPTLHSDRLSAAELTRYATQIYGKMQDQMALFPTPSPSLTVLEDAIADYRIATTEAAFRDTRAITIRNQSREVLEDILYELSKYVDTVAKGDPGIVLAAGFIPSKSKGSRHGRPPKANSLWVKSDYIGSGRVELRTDPWAGARMYQFELRIKDSGDAWREVLSSKSTCVVTGLESFTEYEFRVAYRGVDPEVIYSDVINSYVL